MVKFIKLKSLPIRFQLTNKYSALLQDQQVYLLVLAITLALLHLLLAWKLTTGELKSNRLLPSDILSFEAPFWATIILLVYRNRQQDSYNTSIQGSFVAWVLLAWVVVRTITLSWLDVDFFILSPFLAAFGLWLLAKGLQGIKQIGSTLLLLCFMLVPTNTPYMSSWLHVEQLTTATSAFLLHYIGFKATYHDTLLTLPTGQVQVSYLCASGPLIIILLKVSLLMAIAFPMSWARKLGLALSAVATGFGLGCIRVAFLAVVVNNDKVFHYWHSKTGSEIFLSLGTVAFVLLCTWLIPTEELHSQVREASATNSTTKWRIPLLMSAAVGVAFSIIYLLILPPEGKRFKPSTTNFTLDLNGWQLKERQSISQVSMLKDVTPGFEGMLQGRKYRYVNHEQIIDIRVLYIVNTVGNMNPWLEQLTLTKVEDIPKHLYYLKGIGYYALTNDDNLAYLTACINPRGASTVTDAQFTRDRYSYDLTWNRVVPWLLGKELLTDNRCIWVQLSTPLKGTTTTSAYQLLESVWGTNYTKWHV